jgi:hypothetical protein
MLCPTFNFPAPIVHINYYMAGEGWKEVKKKGRKEE